MDKRAELQNIILTTERSRIKAESRLNSYELIGKLLTTWYSVLLVVLSIFQGVLRQHFQYVDETSIALSVVLLTCTTAVSGLRFGQRADLFKSSYHEMQRLRVAIDYAKEDELPLIHQKYVDSLDNSPNHTDLDYKSFIVERWLEGRGKDDPIRKPSWSERFSYIRQLGCRWTLIVILWTAPLALAIWMYCVW